jgi:uncharacterized protein
MKASEIAVFFAVVFTLYGLLNWYIFMHGWRAIPPDSGLRAPFAVLYLSFMLAFVAGRFLERVWISPLSDALVWIGSLWIGAFVYFFLAALAVDIVRLANLPFGFLPAEIDPQTKLRLLGGVCGAVALILLAGAINAASPTVRSFTVSVPKQAGADRTYRIVAASDIHLGTLIGRGRLHHLVDRINGMDADLVLFPGDIVDEDLGPVVKENLGEVLREIRSRDGVYAVTGNHEYIGGVEPASRYLTEHGIVMLRDSVVRLANGIVLIGREDRTNRGRKPLEALAGGLDPAAPTILMDHQPFHLEEAASLGIDLQLSGHTHHGQMWPLSFITEAIYERSWGLLQKGKTTIYVSCGFGTWGPPVRLGSRPEILDITLKFEGSGEPR